MQPKEAELPDISWTETALVTGTLGVEEEVCDTPDIEIIEEPTRDAVKQQAVSAIRLLKNAAAAQHQAFQMLENSLKATTMADLPRLIRDMTRGVSLHITF